MKINHLLEYTLLKPTATTAEIEKLCLEAREYGLGAVCIPPPFVKLCKDLLQGSSVKLSTVVGFPFGYSAIEAKLAEILLSIVDGADDLEVVVNFMAIKNNDWRYISNEIIHLLQVMGTSNKTITLIVESGVLTNDELIKCCELYGAADINAIKTSTGYAAENVTTGKLKLMRKHLPDIINIKAYGNINNYDFANQLIQAGASTIGSENCVAIIKEQMLTNNMN